MALPGHIENTKKVLLWLKQNVISDVYISIMAQYFPTYESIKEKNLSRKLTIREYKKVEEFVYSLNLQNGYIQSIENSEERYVPNF